MKIIHRFKDGKHIYEIRFQNGIYYMYDTETHYIFDNQYSTAYQVINSYYSNKRTKEIFESFKKTIWI